MRKVFIFLFIGMFLASLASVSAWTFDDVFIEGNLNPKTGYPNLEIKNCDFWLGVCLNPGETIFEGSVTEHTKTCGEDCSSKLEINHAGGVLIDEIKFLTEQEDETWNEQAVRSYRFYYEGEVPEYETQSEELPEVCEIYNGTEQCYTPLNYTEVFIGMKDANITYKVGEDLPAGNYELFLEAQKKPSRTVDWIIKIQGKGLDEWAVWQGANDLILSSNQELCGNYTGYNNIIINNSATITACDYTGSGDTGIVRLQSYGSIIVETGSTFEATGEGYNGGAYQSSGGHNGLSGQGTNNGFGGYYDESCGSSTTASGGSGAGHVNAGGSSSGSNYDGLTASGRSGGVGGVGTLGNKTIIIGAGGGTGGGGSCNSYSTSGAGGAGGGAIILTAPTIIINGTVETDGANGANGGAEYSSYTGAGSGGGAGGTLLLISKDLTINGELSSRGGSGGSGYNSPRATSGGVGSDGRIKIFYETISNATATIDIGTGTTYYNISTYEELIGYGIVTLNSPTDNFVSDTPAITFNATAEVTDGAYITNMSLWTNLTGVWLLNETTPLIYDLAEDASLDTSLWTNVTSTSESSIIEASGYIRVKAGYVNAADVPTSATLTSINLVNESNSKYFSVNLSNIHLYKQCNAGGGSMTSRIKIGSTTLMSYGSSTTGCGSHETLYENSPYLIEGKYEDSQWYYRQNYNYTRSWAGITNYDSNGWTSWTTFDGGELQIYQYSGNEYGGYTSTSTYIDVETSLTSFPPIESNTYTWDKIITDTSIWNVEACDTDGDCGFATSNFTVGLDDVLPSISIASPVENYDYGYVNETVDLNFTVTDASLEDCWYNYNGTNITIEGCVTGVQNSTTIQVEEGNYNITVWANDSVSNLGSTFINWSYEVFETGRIHTDEDYETNYTTYKVNVTADSSLTAVNLNFNGTDYVMSQSGSVWTYSRDLPTTVIGNNSINYSFIYAGSPIESYTSYQNINNIVFGLCNATLTVPYINYSFKDESDLTSINASIQTSSWEYHIGQGTQTESMLYSSITENPNYEFCFSPGITDVYVDVSMNYLDGTYPIRTYNPATLTLTNASQNKILYLLDQDDGIYTTFITLTSTNAILADVEITITRDISGTPTTIGQGTTDASGAYTAWLNPNYAHTISAYKTGFSVSTQTINPTQSQYSIYLTSTTNYTYTSNADGLLWAIFPTVGLINQSQVQNYGFNISSINDNIVKCKIELLDIEKTEILDSNEVLATNSSYCSVSVPFDPETEGHPRFKGRLLIDIGEGYVILEEDAYWAVEEVDTTGMTLKDWFRGLKSTDLKYFNNNENHREYTNILIFFLVVLLICGVLNQFGWDIQTNGGMIFLVGFCIWFASGAGFLELKGVSPIEILNKHFIAVVYSMFMIGFAMRNT